METIKNYPGGKNGSGVYQHIINLIPCHDVYLECFLGSGSILRNKLPAQFSIALDRNIKCIDAGRKLNLPCCILINDDAISFLKMYLSLSILLKYYDVRSFIYLDPPYPFEVRKGNKKIYKYEFSTADHIRLLEVIGSTSIPVMISSYRNVLYDNTLKNWTRYDFPAVTRKGRVTESLYFNYPVPDQLHDYRYIGNDFRERERNRGIIFRNVSKFNKMRPDIRNAILNQLKNRF